MKKVLLIFGGNSTENNVSRKSAKSIIQNIDEDKFTLTSVYVDCDNKWYIFDNLIYIEDDAWIKKQSEIKNIIKFLKSFDVVFPIIHGTNGEDGKLQGMLELFNIPFVGCRTTSSALTMDKGFSKLITQALNINQVPFLIINSQKYNYLKIVKELKFPMIVKPANGGSSIGINKARNNRELIKAIKEASKHDKKIVIEEFVKMRELECAIVENKKLIISPVGEIINKNEFYDYQSKYEFETETIINTKLPKKIEKQIKNISKKIFTNFDCKGLSRIDFFYDELNEILYFNEINTLPGFTSISMFPKLLISDNITYKNLITLLIENSTK